MGGNRSDLSDSVKKLAEDNRALKKEVNALTAANTTAAAANAKQKRELHHLTRKVEALLAVSTKPVVDAKKKGKGCGGSL